MPVSVCVRQQTSSFINLKSCTICIKKNIIINFYELFKVMLERELKQAKDGNQN